MGQAESTMQLSTSTTERLVDAKVQQEDDVQDMIVEISSDVVTTTKQRIVVETSHAMQETVTSKTVATCHKNMLDEPESEMENDLKMPENLSSDQTLPQSTKLLPNDESASARPNTSNTCARDLPTTCPSRARHTSKEKSGNLESNQSSGIFYEEEKISGNIRRYEAFDDTGRPVTIAQWASMISENSNGGRMARSRLIQLIEDAPFKGIFFETMGVTFKQAKDEPFSFVLINSPELYRFGKEGSDRLSFADHFDRPGGARDAVSFYNLGKDARLVVPRPVMRDNYGPYCHLAKFVREAPNKQVDAVFAMVGQEYLRELQKVPSRPIWLSTSGLGVAWLHFRLDTSPKYYQYRLFAKGIASSARSERRRNGKK